MYYYCLFPSKDPREDWRSSGEPDDVRVRWRPADCGGYRGPGETRAVGAQEGADTRRAHHAHRTEVVRICIEYHITLHCTRMQLQLTCSGIINQ